jgi:hypothetical protein
MRLGKDRHSQDRLNDEANRQLAPWRAACPWRSDSERQEYLIAGVDRAGEPSAAFAALDEVAFAAFAIDRGVGNS